MPSVAMTADEVIQMFQAFDMIEAERLYLHGQAKRIAYLRNLVQRHCAERDEVTRILDVGPHFLSRVLVDTILPRPRISTLGRQYLKLMPADLVWAHAQFDLNECGSSPPPFEPGSFDIIMLAEVVEHLYIPPSIVLTFLKALLTPGGIIILGTPNAVSISKRIKMMLGENPYSELLPDNRYGLIHTREYTMHELRKYGESSDLVICFEEYCDYWDQSYFPGSPQITAAERDVPIFRGGLTVIYKLPAQTT